MRIVFFQICEGYGGSSRSLVELAKRLKSHVEVVVVDVYGRNNAFTEAVRAAGLEYHVLAPQGKITEVGSRSNPLRRMLRLAGKVPEILRLKSSAKKLLAELKPSVVISSDFRSILPLGIAPSMKHIPLVVHMRGWWTPDMLAAYSKWLARKRCAALLAVSHQTKTALVCANIDPRKIHVLHNPIDVTEMQALADRPLDSPLPQADRAVRLLLPGAIIRWKRLHTAVSAMKPILDAGHDAVLWIAGDLDQGDSRYVAECDALADRLGVADRVEWLGLRSDIPQVIKAASMVVLPSWSEGHPRVSLEAMALERPFVATPVGGVLDMVLPGVTGMLFEVEDPAGMAEQVCRLADDPQLAKRIVAQARQYVEQNFMPDQQIERILAIFEQISSNSQAN